MLYDFPFFLIIFPYCANSSKRIGKFNFSPEQEILNVWLNSPSVSPWYWCSPHQCLMESKRIVPLFHQSWWVSQLIQLFWDNWRSGPHWWPLHCIDACMGGSDCSPLGQILVQQGFRLHCVYKSVQHSSACKERCLFGGTVQTLLQHCSGDTIEQQNNAKTDLISIKPASIRNFIQHTIV